LPGLNPNGSIHASRSEVIRLGFDDIEAYAYMTGGTLILRLDPNLIIVKLPKMVVRWDFIGYLEKIGAEVKRVERRRIYFTYEALGYQVDFVASPIFRYADSVYLAVTPLDRDADTGQL
jgi:hypothetical protein